MNNLFDGYLTNRSQIKDRLAEKKNVLDSYQSQAKNAYHIIEQYGTKQFFNANDTENANKYLQALQALDIFGAIGNVYDDYGNIIGQKIYATIDEIAEIPAIIRTKYKGLVDEKEYIETQLNSADSTFAPYLETWLEEEYVYKNLNDTGLKLAIQEALFNFDWDALPDGAGWEEASEYLRRNILFSINNIDGTEVSKALSDIYTGNLTSGKMLDAIAKVQSYFGESHPISLSLEPKIKDIEPLVNNVKDKLKGTEFDNRVGELTLEDLQIAADLKVDDDSIQSWDELLKRIEEAQKQVSSPTSFSLSESEREALKEYQTRLELLNKLKDEWFSSDAIEKSDLLQSFAEQFPKYNLMELINVKNAKELEDDLSNASTLNDKIEKSKSILSKIPQKYHEAIKNGIIDIKTIDNKQYFKLIEAKKVALDAVTINSFYGNLSIKHIYF